MMILAAPVSQPSIILNSASQMSLETDWFSVRV